MFNFSYKCDCCQAESRISGTDDTTSPPRLPPDWRRFNLEQCIYEDTAGRFEAQSWELEISLDLCPECSEHFRNHVGEYKAAIADYNKSRKEKVTQ